MTEEIEAKIVNIDIKDVEKRLLQIGAEKLGEKLFQRTIFDFPGFPLDKQAAWLRLRNEGDQITMAFKQRLGVKEMQSGDNDSGMKEIEVKVDDFQKTSEILLSIGLIEKFSLENKRISWKKENVLFDIDIWPRLNPYIEIEAPTWEEVDNAIIALGFDPADKKICSTTQIYQQAGIRDKDYIKMTFKEFVKRDE